MPRRASPFWCEPNELTKTLSPSGALACSLRSQAFRFAVLAHSFAQDCPPDSPALAGSSPSNLKRLRFRRGLCIFCPRQQRQNLPSCASPFGRLGPLPVRKSMGLSFDGRALAGSSPLRRKSQKIKSTTRGGAFDFGTPSGARTPDTLIKSQVLYQLS